MSGALQPFVDVPADEPGLDVPDVAKVLAGRLLGAVPPRMTTGVFGGYGTGKTTLMGAIRRELDEFKSVSRPNSRTKPTELPVHTVWFEAWRYDHELHLLVPLLAQLAETGAFKDTWKEKLFDAMRGFIRGWTFNLPLASVSVPAMLDGESKSQAEREPDIQKLTSGFTDFVGCLRQVTHNTPKRGEPYLARRVVVFVDDLDRCAPGKALGLLESLMAYLDVPGFIFVIGLDPRAVETYLRTKYDESFAVDTTEYIEKLVQDAYYPPPMEMPNEKEDFRQLLLGSRDAETTKGVDEVLELAFEARKYLPANIRRIKRILNVHQIAMTLDDTGRLRSEALLYLLVLSMRWKSVYQEIPFGNARAYERFVKSCREAPDEPISGDLGDAVASARGCRDFLFDAFDGGKLPHTAKLAYLHAERLGMMWRGG